MNQQRLHELLKDHQIYHSDLQMDCFITGTSGGTFYGLYKQALRELDKRWRALRHLYIERERLRLKIPGNVVAWLRTKKRALDDVEARFALEDLGRNIADTQREFTRFLEQADALKKRVGELTPERRAVLDEEFWVDRLRRTAAIECMTAGRPNANTIECINALPGKARERLLSDCDLTHRDALVQWYLSRRSPPPSIAALPCDDAEGAKALPRLTVESLISEADDKRATEPDGVTELCRKQGGGRVRGLFRKAFSFVAVLASGLVPDAVYETRMAYCRSCLRLELAIGRLWCGCCGCSRWTRGEISSSLEYKNRKAAWGCPLSKPAFGPCKVDPVGDLATTIAIGSVSRSEPDEGSG